jgi:hypothetical protein
MALIVCTDATEFIYDVWEDGWPDRPGALRHMVQAGKEERKELQLTAQMIRDTDTRLMAEIRSRDERLTRRVAAMEERIDIIVDVHLAALEKELRQQHLDQDTLRIELTARQEQLRAGLQTEIENAAMLATRAASESGRARDLAEANKLQTDDLARLLTHHISDRNVLDALHAELAEIMRRERARLQPVLDQLAGAVDELQRPDLVRHVNVLMNKNEPWDRRANALLHVVNEVAQMVLVPGSGWVKAVLVGIPAVKAASDFFIDSRERAKRKGS